MEHAGHPRNHRWQVLFAERDIVAIKKAKRDDESMSRWIYDAVQHRLGAAHWKDV